jgi:hypothetical protein
MSLKDRAESFLRGHPFVRLCLALLTPGLMLLSSALFFWASPITTLGLAEIPDLVIASYATWALLTPWLVGRSIRGTVVIGVASPFLGALILLLLWTVREGPIAYEAGIRGVLEGIIGGMIYVVLYIVKTIPVTLALGLATAFVLRALLWDPRRARA